MCPPVLNGAPLTRCLLFSLLLVSRSIGPLMVSRLILNLRGAHDAQKTHAHISGISSKSSAQRGIQSERDTLAVNGDAGPVLI